MAEKDDDFENVTLPLMKKFEKEVFQKVFPNSTFFQKYTGSKLGSFKYDGLFNDTKYKIDPKV